MANTTAPRIEYGRPNSDASMLDVTVPISRRRRRLRRLPVRDHLCRKGGAASRRRRVYTERPGRGVERALSADEISQRKPRMYEALVRLFTGHYGRPPRSILEIAGDGSNRSYYRLIGEDLRTAVGAVGPDDEENRTFIAFSRKLLIGKPHNYGVDPCTGSSKTVFSTR
jgi:hypothetical protein